MKLTILTHIILGAIVTGLFFGLGFIDMNRLGEATLKHKPSLLFAHSKAIAHDGGSIHWDSLIYSGHEGRRMRIWEEDGKTVVADGFQGQNWTWKYHNLIWIYLVIAGSLMGSLLTNRFKRTEESINNPD